jgi:hypothetical protein
MRRLIGLFAVAATLGGCAWTADEPTSDRDRMISQADKAYKTALSQGVDLRRTPCIYDDGGDWVVVVDYKQRNLSDAASECPTFERGQATHAVILNPEGEVITAQ